MGMVSTKLSEERAQLDFQDSSLCRQRKKSVILQQDENYNDCDPSEVESSTTKSKTKSMLDSTLIGAISSVWSVLPGISISQPLAYVKHEASKLMSNMWYSASTNLTAEPVNKESSSKLESDLWNT